jgi:serine/threonine protein kinase
MAPEVWKEEAYGEKADIWAFGCLLFELVMFKKPFEGKNQDEVKMAAINAKLEPLPLTVDTDV